MADAQVIVKHTHGLAFFGTPFRDSKAVQLADRIRKIVDVCLDTNETNLGDLDEKSRMLWILRDAFPDVLSKRSSAKNGEDSVEVVVFYEQLKTGGVMVVDAESATIPSCGNKVSIRANHVNICRFETRDDGDYQNVAQALKKLSESAGHNEARSAAGVIFYNYAAEANQVGGNQWVEGGIHHGTQGGVHYGNAKST